MRSAVAICNVLDWGSRVASSRSTAGRASSQAKVSPVFTF